MKTVKCMNTVKCESAIEAFGYSLAITSVLSVILVIIKEKNEAVMAIMKAVTPHHWITHGVIVVGLFVVLGLILTRLMPARSTVPDFNRAACSILATTVISGMALAGFFLFGG
jgi:hypothetical protein